MKKSSEEEWIDLEVNIHKVPQIKGRLKPSKFPVHAALCDSCNARKAWIIDSKYVGAA